MRISAYTDFRFYGTALPENAESRPPWCSLFRQPGLEPSPYARRRNTSAISFYALGACTSRWPLRRFVECGSGSHVVPLTIFPRCAYGATRRSIAPAWVLRAVQTPVNPRVRLYGKAGIRKFGSAEGEGAR